jgi:hypothetical protein
MPLTSSPESWGAGNIGKRYLSLDEAIQDGITEGDANYGLLHYFIKEFFRVAGPSELYVVNQSEASFAAQSFYALTEGEVRQAYWYSTNTYGNILAHVTTVKAFTAAMDALFAPLVVVTSIKDEVTILDGASQVDARGAVAQEVSILISGSGTGEAGDLADSLGVKYIPAGGTILGALAFGAVNESLGWVDKFNLRLGDEFREVVFSDGVEFKQKTDAVLTALDEKGYLFLRNHQGITGAYVNDTHTATLATSDFAFIENVRTIQKAKRNVRQSLLPQLSSPLTVDADGKLSASTITFFEQLASRPLDRMQAAGELSNYSVIIDPDQNVLQTSQLNIQIKIQPRGVARNILVTIGLAASI